MKKIGVFASGRGSNFVKIYENIEKGEISAEVCCLITDNASAAAIDFSKTANIPTYVVHPKSFSNSTAFGEELLKILKNNAIEWVVLAGYLKKIPENVVKEYSNRIINIHPALLPSFGGKGMYGMNVHEAVFNSGAKISGVTIHLVNEIYDSGPIVMQESVNIESCRKPEEISKRVLQVEHTLYSKALQKLLTTPFQISLNRVEFKEI
ncbi:MAG: phosphoribosylglycinamide formyltransferase [Calditrichia bacterium]|nr:phosphoribosylglycinamide formyltransferase [Calditrichia bacterium]